jgi:hypothetical protein
MNLFKAFLCSLRLPQKEAMFRLNRMTMGKTVAYLFVFMMAVSITGAVQFSVSPHPSLAGEIPPTLFILQFVSYKYAVCVFVGFVGISLLAWIGHSVGKSFQRKLSYRQIWKISAYAATLPLLLFTLAQALNLQYGAVQWFLFLLALAIVIRLILHFPKRQS